MSNFRGLATTSKGPPRDSVMIAMTKQTDDGTTGWRVAMSRWQNFVRLARVSPTVTLNPMRHLTLALALALLVGAIAAPARADTKKRETGALVLLIDRSGSMQGPKLDAAKDAAKAAASALHPDDMVAVVAFDSEATDFLKPTKAGSKAEINKSLDRLTAGGGTSFYPGLKEAYEILKGLKADKKHVILLSDGESPDDGIEDLLKDMKNAKITVSTVAVPGGEEVLLEKISDDGGGRMYKVTDLKTLSQTYVKELKEAKLALK